LDQTPGGCTGIASGQTCVRIYDFFYDFVSKSFEKVHSVRTL
jgi:hypothetical protein